VLITYPGFPLTYLEFHLVFLLPPLALLAASASVRRVEQLRLQLAGLAVVVGLALLYTTPWDNYLIAREVWWYGESRVARRFWLAPLGEYLFILVQPAVAALWLFHLTPPGPAADAGADMSTRDRLLGGVAGLAVSAVGVAMLTRDSTFYMGAILAWAGPVFALQWAVGWRYLLSTWRYGLLAVGPPTLYLWAVDRIAIADGIWVISSRFTTGVTLFGLPVEEALFFLVTNLFVVQALVLLPWVVRRWR